MKLLRALVLPLLLVAVTAINAYAYKVAGQVTLIGCTYTFVGDAWWGSNGALHFSGTFYIKSGSPCPPGGTVTFNVKPDAPNPAVSESNYDWTIVDNNNNPISSSAADRQDWLDQLLAQDPGEEE